MSIRTAAWIAGAVVLASLAAGILALVQIPDGRLVATHFDAAGRPNGWMPASVAFFIMPAVGALMWVVQVLAPRVTPRGENLQKSSAAYGTIWIVATLFVALGQGLIVASALGHPVEIEGLFPVLTGLVFVLVGNVLPKLRWNYVVGVRTPWTLADERVWDRTHRFGGVVMVAGGMVLIAGAMAVPVAVQPALILGVGTLVAALTVGKSYLAWRELARPRSR